MPNRIPIKSASDFGKAHDLRQVIIFAWDGELTHCVTWGKTVDDCDQATVGGNALKQALGWPESLQSTPSRVKKLQKENARLLARVAELENERLVAASLPTP